MFVGALVYNTALHFFFKFSEFYFNLGCCLLLRGGFEIKFDPGGNQSTAIDYDDLPFALHQLRKWKKSHVLISDTIDAIGDCFGQTLFLSILLLLTRLIALFLYEFEYIVSARSSSFLILSAFFISSRYFSICFSFASQSLTFNSRYAHAHHFSIFTSQSCFPN